MESINRIDKCSYCNEQATHTLLEIKNYFFIIKIKERYLCDKCRIIKQIK